MSKNQELEMTEILLAYANGNRERGGRILARLDFDQREKLAGALFKTLSATLSNLPAGAMYRLLEEYGFELVKEAAASEP